jgi:hypothetical protein
MEHAIFYNFPLNGTVPTGNTKKHDVADSTTRRRRPTPTADRARRRRTSRGTAPRGDARLAGSPHSVALLPAADRGKGAVAGCPFQSLDTSDRVEHTCPSATVPERRSSSLPPTGRGTPQRTRTPLVWCRDRASKCSHPSTVTSTTIRI